MDTYTVRSRFGSMTHAWVAPWSAGTFVLVTETRWVAADGTVRVVSCARRLVKTDSTLKARWMLAREVARCGFRMSGLLGGIAYLTT